MDGEDHVAGGVRDHGLFLAGEVVQELVGAFEGGLGWLGLLGGEGAEGGEDGAIDAAGEIEKFSDDLLDEFDAV